MRVGAANGSAREAGIVAGLTLSDAAARVPTLLSEEIDRASDAAALRKLADWHIRFTPLVAVDAADGLMLETTGCDHLFGGEEAMLDTLSDILGKAGFTHRIGLAGTPIAAAALTHGGACDQKPTCLPQGTERGGLQNLQMSALRLNADVLVLLRRFGLPRIGQLYGIDRKALARRFQSQDMASQVLTVLDQALGLRAAPITPIRPAPDYAARLPCHDPLLDLVGVRAGLEEMTYRVCADLAAHGRGARHFSLHAFRADGTSSTLSVMAARPVRTPRHILRLFAERLETIDPGFGIDLLALEAFRTGSMQSGTPSLSAALSGHGIDETEIAALADQITARLGPDRVFTLAPVDRHLPEAACRRAPYDGNLPQWSDERPALGPRPICLFARPEPVDVIAEVPDGPPLRFRWRRVPRQVVRADGPERIAPEWWTHTPSPRQPDLPSDTPLRSPTLAPLGATAPPGASKHWLVPKMDPRADAAHIEKTRAELNRPHSPSAPATSNKPLPRARDYYRVEDEAGHRYWLFRDGLYDDGRGGTPQWYVHGVGP